MSMSARIPNVVNIRFEQVNFNDFSTLEMITTSRNWKGRETESKVEMFSPTGGFDDELLKVLSSMPHTVEEVSNG